jgi:lipopolysaccharide transport system ATP-binding protein
MDKDIAIKVDHVSKKYCKSLKKSMIYGVSDIAKNSVGLGSHPENLRKDEFWAIDDVSFEVKKGETLGIIGPNGSGKTTLLKMLNGIFWPDRGKISIRGKVGALIAVGAGFHPMLTGRENIYINAAIMGMRKKEVDEKLEDIIQFAEIGDFLDVPVKFYSSGMYVRLGFAVAVHCEPEILLVDEVLAVGDRDFQIKCYRRMHELKKDEDTSIVLVSHYEYAMRQWAQKAIVMQHGKMKFCGAGEDAISYYLNNITLQSETNSPPEGSFFDKGLLQEVTFKNAKEEEIRSIHSGDKLIVDFEYNAPRIIKSPIFGISFYNINGLFAGFWNSYENVRLPDIKGAGTVRLTIDPLDLPIDSYQCTVVVNEEEESNILEWKDLKKKLVVERPNNARGLVKLRHNWSLIKK